LRAAAIKAVPQQKAFPRKGELEMSNWIRHQPAGTEGHQAKTGISIKSFDFLKLLGKNKQKVKKI